MLLNPSFSLKCSNVPELCFHDIVIRAKLSNQCTGVLAVPQLVFRCISFFQKCVLLVASPWDKILTRLKWGSPVNREQVVVFLLESLSHFDFLSWCWVVKVESAVCHKGLPHFRLQSSVIARNHESLRLFVLWERVVGSLHFFWVGLFVIWLHIVEALLNW